MLGGEMSRTCGGAGEMIKETSTSWTVSMELWRSITRRGKHLGELVQLQENRLNQQMSSKHQGIPVRFKMKIERVLRGYRKANEEMLIEISIDCIPEVELRELFGLPDNNPLYDCYPVGQAAEHLLRSQNQIPVLDHDNIEYLLECCGSPQ